MQNGAAVAAPSSCTTVAVRSSHPVDEIADHFRHTLHGITGLLYDRRRDALGARDWRLLPCALATARALSRR